MSGEYCIYLRKSRADEGMREQTVEEILGRHEKALLDLGRQMKLNITKIYREVVSGDTIASRPVVQELLSSVETGCWTGVLVMEVERLARGDTIDQGIISQTFKYSNTKIITPVKIYNPNNEFDEEYFEFGLFMSRREYKVINRRLQRGRLASVKEGKYLGTKSPYGYDRVQLQGSKGFSLAINESEAKIVRLIYDMYTNGICNENGNKEHIGIQKICRRLQNSGIKPRYSKSWSPSTVRGILTNPVYIGKIRWDYRKTVNKISNGQKIKTRPRNNNLILVDGVHEPIISNNIFEAAQNLLSQNKSTPIGEKLKTTNPLAGLIICSKCGHKLVARPYKGVKSASMICTTVGCKNVGSALHLIESRILSSLSEWLDNYYLNLKSPNYKIDNTLEADFSKEKLKEINNEVNVLDTQMNSLYDFLEQGVYTPDIFLERSKIISDKRNELENQMQFLQKISKAQQISITKDEFAPRMEKVLLMYNELEDAEVKNIILKEVIEKVVYTKTTKGTRNNSDNFEIVIYPRLPNTKIKSLPKYK